MEISCIQDIKQLGINEPFQTLAILKKISEKTAKNDSLFFLLEFGDQTGSFVVTCFDNSPFFSQLKTTPEGKIVRLSGTSDYYQNRFSPKIHEFYILSEEEIAESDLLATLVESSPEDPDAMWEELQKIIDTILRPELKQTVLLALNDIESTFRTSSAAVSMHHAYRNGLLEHTLHVVRAGKALLPLYPEVDPDLAIAGMILHDIGKCLEYASGLTTKRTKLGVMQGHVVLGYRLMRKAALQAKLHPELIERLEHIILSHQGELEWGAATLACTPEAVFVSLVDNLDAKMGVVQYALRHANPNEELSDFLPALRTQLVTKPPTA